MEYSSFSQHFSVLEGLNLQEMRLKVFNWSKVVSWCLIDLGLWVIGRMKDGMIFSTQKEKKSFFILVLRFFLKNSCFFIIIVKKSSLWIFFFLNLQIFNFFNIISLDAKWFLLYLHKTDIKDSLTVFVVSELLKYKQKGIICHRRSNVKQKENLGK